MKIQFIFLCICLFAFTAQAQTITKGLIVPKDPDTFGSCCVYVPTLGISIYDHPNGKVLGKIIQGTKQDQNGDFYTVFLVLDDHKKTMENPSLFMVGNDIMALMYVQQKSNFVKTVSGYWLDIIELNKKGLENVNWMQFLIRNSDHVLGYYANNPGLNLRKSPSTQSELILTMKGDLMEIKLTEEVKGLWCKAIVTEYSEHPCASKGNFEEIKLRSYKGWIKLLSDDFTPNVSFYAKGC